MMKKTLLYAASIFALLVLGVLLFVKDFEISISEIAAQNAIAEHVAEGSVERFGVSIDVKSADIDFKDNNTSEIFVDLSTNGHGYSGKFNGKVASSVDLRNSRIYLNDLSLIEGGFTTDAETQGELGEMKKVATDFLKRVRSDKTDKTGKTLDNSEDKSTEILETYVTDATYKFFQTIPIFDLRDLGMKGHLMGLALKSVTYSEHDVSIVVSPVQALLRILTMILFSAITLLLIWFNFGGGLPKRKANSTEPHSSS